MAWYFDFHFPVVTTTQYFFNDHPIISSVMPPQFEGSKVAMSFRTSVLDTECGRAENSHEGFRAKSANHSRCSNLLGMEFHFDFCDRCSDLPRLQRRLWPRRRSRRASFSGRSSKRRPSVPTCAAQVKVAAAEVPLGSSPFERGKKIRFGSQARVAPLVSATSRAKAS